MKAFKSETEIRIEDGYLHRESIKEIPGRRYEPDCKAWFVPLCAENVALLQTLGAEIDAELGSLFNNSKAIEVENEEPITKMPIKAEPYKHQVRAFNFALKILCGFRAANPISDCKDEDSEAAQSAKEAREGGDANDIQ